MNLPFLSVRLADLEVGRRAPFDGGMSPSRPSLHCTTAVLHSPYLFAALVKQKWQFSHLGRSASSLSIKRFELMVRAASRRCTTSHPLEGVHPSIQAPASRGTPRAARRRSLTPTIAFSRTPSSSSSSFSSSSFQASRQLTLKISGNHRRRRRLRRRRALLI